MQVSVAFKEKVTCPSNLWLECTCNDCTKGDSNGHRSVRKTHIETSAFWTRHLYGHDTGNNEDAPTASSGDNASNDEMLESHGRGGNDRSHANEHSRKEHT